MLVSVSCSVVKKECTSFVYAFLGKGSDVTRWKLKVPKTASKPHVVQALIDANLGPFTAHLDKGFIGCELPPDVVASIPSQSPEEELEEEVDDELEDEELTESNAAQVLETLISKFQNKQKEAAEAPSAIPATPLLVHSIKVSLGRISVEHFFGNIKSWDRLGNVQQNKALQFFYQFIVCCVVFRYRML